MRPIIGSALPRKHGLYVQREGEPFPGTPWKGDPIISKWEFVLMLLGILATVAILMLPLWLS